ncbi:MAG: DUF6305 family protein [Sphaerochaetaceae bacterium]|jgi:hypothetical protein|nr:DUF6305 family protein [Sphaerochaetaceae bacterium]MDD4007113.1 DUF6305 family protein [Sphaerochaetaceae bacterium]MDD4397334.1 DUF6305 family protein [Sphaerochaetaceae bacterium]
MKKIIVVLLAIALLIGFGSCSKAATPAAAAPAANTPSTGTVDSEYDPNATVDFEMKTSADKRVVTIGEIDKSLYQSPIFVTSFGQSTDAAMLDTVMKRVGIDYHYNPTATADDIAGSKTVIIAVGASTKGLGAAGISEADETARAKAIMKQIKADGSQVICCHIGGSSRRGALSDELADMVMKQCSYIVLKEDANFDSKFTDFASAHNIPISLIFATKDTVSVFTDIFK